MQDTFGYNWESKVNATPNSHESDIKLHPPFVNVHLLTLCCLMGKQQHILSVLRNELGSTAFSTFSMIINRESGSVEEAYRLVSLDTHYGLRFWALQSRKVVECCLMSYGWLAQTNSFSVSANSVCSLKTKVLCFSGEQINRGGHCVCRSHQNWPHGHKVLSVASLNCRWFGDEPVGLPPVGGSEPELISGPSVLGTAMTYLDRFVYTMYLHISHAFVKMRINIYIIYMERDLYVTKPFNGLNSS